MYCPKCGHDNPDDGKFCRGCGANLAGVSTALAGLTPTTVDGKKAKTPSLETALTKLFMGVAFLAISIALAFTIGRSWWFWLLIPAASMIGTGIAQYIQYKNHREGLIAGQLPTPVELPPRPQAELPAPPANYTSPDSRYKTGDLAPPSVTDATTRHLSHESEDKTMALLNEDRD